MKLKRAMPMSLAQNILCNIFIVIVVNLFLDDVDAKGVVVMKDMVSVSISGSGQTDLLGGPIAAQLMISNWSSNSVEILLPYPNPNNLDFCSQSDAVENKSVEPQSVERTIPIYIAPSERYTTVYFLNRYMRFNKPGEYTVSYTLELPIGVVTKTGDSQHETIVATGSFVVALRPATEEELRAKLSRYAADLTSSDRRIKMESAEALAFLETPVAIDYLEPMLTIDNLEVIGIEALARHSSEKCHQLIVGMLAHPDSVVVAVALAAIKQAKILVSRRLIQDLLTSSNSNIQWLALDFLSASPDKSDLEYVLPLLTDENSAVRSQAEAYIKALQ